MNTTFYRTISNFSIGIIYCLLITPYVHGAEENREHKKPQIRVLTGTGFQNLGQVLHMSDRSFGLGTPYEYQINFYEIQYQWQAKAYKTSSLDLLIMPQVNHTRFKKELESMQVMQGVEAGINVGIAIRKNSAHNKQSYFVALSSGPHYVSDTPSRQTPGFIFSDNLFVGLDYQIIRNINACFQLGFRHISNAGFSNPNGGVNNVIAKAGISLNL